MISTKRSARPRVRGVAALAAGAALLASCSTSSTPTSAPTSALAPRSNAAPTSTTAPSGQGSGPVDVLYAGSLVDLMEKGIGPDFDRATGFNFDGQSGNAGALANEIKAKTVIGDVFIGAAPSNDAALEGTPNGNWVSWYATFADSPLVVGYNPKSRYAADFTTMPWYKVVSLPGILVGRTDPATDPKGALTVTALQDAASAQGEPALDKLATDSADVYPEDTLVGRLQAGQLDAGFFYSVEAKAGNFPTVPLTGEPSPLEAKYTITVLAGAPHLDGADAFVKFLLGPTGSADLAKYGLVVSHPVPVSGTVPAGLSGVLSGS
ncbi:MAG: substrate-binding domain-containing protein [Acidimicrobiales bacterium]